MTGRAVVLSVLAVICPLGSAQFGSPFGGRPQSLSGLTEFGGFPGAPMPPAHPAAQSMLGRGGGQFGQMSQMGQISPYGSPLFGASTSQQGYGGEMNPFDQQMNAFAPYGMAGGFQRRQPYAGYPTMSGQYGQSQYGQMGQMGQQLGGGLPPAFASLGGGSSMSPFNAVGGRPPFQRFMDSSQSTQQFQHKKL